MWIVDEDILGHTIISAKQARTYLDKKSLTKQWLAVISGIDPKFGFKRDFVKRQQSDYRPDFWEMLYILETGKIYEYKNFYVAMGEYVSGFFAVNEQNKILTLEKDEVRRLLNMPVKSWSNKNEERTKFKLEEYVKDDIPF
jgi:hypothetical protein